MRLNDLIRWVFSFFFWGGSALKASSETPGNIQPAEIFDLAQRRKSAAGCSLLTKVHLDLLTTSSYTSSSRLRTDVFKILENPNLF